LKSRRHFEGVGSQFDFLQSVVGLNSFRNYRNTLQKNVTYSSALGEEPMLAREFAVKFHYGDTAD
jgi:hypothetical protein